MSAVSLHMPTPDVLRTGQPGPQLPLFVGAILIATLVLILL